MLSFWVRNEVKVVQYERVTYFHHHLWKVALAKEDSLSGDPMEGTTLPHTTIRGWRKITRSQGHGAVHTAAAAEDKDDCSFSVWRDILRDCVGEKQSFPTREERTARVLSGSR